MQEKLIAISYDALEQDACLALQSALDDFLLRKSERGWRLRECLSTPRMAIPEDSLRSEAPDWSKMRMYVDRCYRYVRADDQVLVQFCKNFMTLNVAAKSKLGQPCPAFSVLVEAFSDMLPFVRDVLVKQVRLRDLQYEVVYRLTEQHLRHLLRSRYQKDRLDYLDVFGLLRSFDSGVNRDMWELDIPLRQDLAYHIKDDADKKRLRINVLVNNTLRTGWFANIDIKASSQCDYENRGSEARIESFVVILPQYDVFQRDGLRRLLTDDMVGRLGDVVS